MSQLYVNDPAAHCRLGPLPVRLSEDGLRNAVPREGTETFIAVIMYCNVSGFKKCGSPGGDGNIYRFDLAYRKVVSIRVRYDY